MEFYTMMQIYKSVSEGSEKIIIHEGLFHTSNLLEWMKDNYLFTVIDSSGLTQFDEIDTIKHNGCYNLPQTV